MTVYLLIRFNYDGIHLYGALESERRAKLWKTKMNKKDGGQNFDFVPFPLNRVFERELEL